MRPLRRGHMVHSDGMTLNPQATMKDGDPQ